MPFKDRKKQLDYLRAWRVVHAEEVRRKKHAYYLPHREEFAERRDRSAPKQGSKEGRLETRLLRSSRALARWRDIPAESRSPVRCGRRRKYVGTPVERHVQAQRIYSAKRKERQSASDKEAAP